MRCGFVGLALETFGCYLWCLYLIPSGSEFRCNAISYLFDLLGVIILVLILFDILVCLFLLFAVRLGFWWEVLILQCVLFMRCLCSAYCC